MLTKRRWWTPHPVLRPRELDRGTNHGDVVAKAGVADPLVETKVLHLSFHFNQNLYREYCTCGSSKTSDILLTGPYGKETPLKTSHHWPLVFLLST